MAKSVQYNKELWKHKCRIAAEELPKDALQEQNDTRGPKVTDVKHKLPISGPKRNANSEAGRNLVLGHGKKHNMKYPAQGDSTNKQKGTKGGYGT